MPDTEVRQQKDKERDATLDIVLEHLDAINDNIRLKTNETFKTCV
jgi:hypothetical protein